MQIICLFEWRSNSNKKPFDKKVVILILNKSVIKQLLNEQTLSLTLIKTCSSIQQSIETINNVIIVMERQ